MRARSLVHLSDGVLVRELKALAGREREATAAVIAHMAEVDSRRLYLPAGYPSMYAYCVQELHLSEDAAYKRIQAARAVRRFPAILDALADGRFHLSGLKLLAPYLTSANAEELARVAGGKTRSQIEQLLAERFPKTESLPLVETVSRPAEFQQQAPGPVQNETVGEAAALDSGPAAVGRTSDAHASSTTTQAPPAADSPRRARTFDPPRADPAQAGIRSRTTPIARERFRIELSVGEATHDKLMHAQALLGHRVPDGDLAQVLDRVLDLAIAQLEKEKYAKTSKPRTRRRHSSANPRYIPAHVKRTVWERDAGRCTFVSASGKRCDSRTRLEFDHVMPVAKGGVATVRNIRLRCRSHNQHEAERVFGSGFMHMRREARTAGGGIRRVGPPPDAEPCGLGRPGQIRRESPRPATIR